jgi:[acyl-carrier-protein] S-malonyltransferase
MTPSRTQPDGAAAPCNALMFPGQGSHKGGMESAHRGTELFERGLEVLGEDPFPHLDESTRWQQPAVFLCSVCDWDAAGRPSAAAALGHSLGEYAGLVAAGALEFEQALRLVDRRGQAMSAAAEAQPGGMVAILGADPEAVATLADALELTVANDNAPGQLVLSGPRERIEQAAERAGEAGAKARVLDVAGAFHSTAMEPALDSLREALSDADFRAPRFPVYSCATAVPFSDPREELATNMIRPVRWREVVLAALAEGIESFEELGPGRVLTGLVRRIEAEAKVEVGA